MAYSNNFPLSSFRANIPGGPQTPRFPNPQEKTPHLVVASQASPLHMDAQQDLQEKNSEIPSPKFNMEPENYAFQKESPFSTS